MIKTIISEELPVKERFTVKKNIITGEADASVIFSASEKEEANAVKQSPPRLCVVTGTHGDELEGQYVCFELARRLNEHLDNLYGTVEIYPALNPLGVDSIQRGFPSFDLDMNRVFPGEVNGHLLENTAYKIIKDLKGADIVLDIHASNIFLREVMQVRVNEQTADTLLPYAKLLNTDFIWVHESATVLESTLAYSLNKLNTKTLVVEMGIGMRITRTYGNRLVDGIFNLMRHLGMWTGEVAEVIADPLLSTDGEVVFINADKSGVIIPSVKHSASVRKGDALCHIVEPFEGKILQDVVSPVDGFVFTMRSYPIVYEGSLIARIYKSDNQDLNEKRDIVRFEVALQK